MLYEILGKEKTIDAECEIISDYKVANDSPDHIIPRDTRNDNSVWHVFNEKLYHFMKGRSPSRVLDLGCAGGGFVESLVEDGHDAFGIEGSNYSLIGKRAAWGTIPARLFKADITKPFALTKKGLNEPVQFDVITAWELMEHFKKEDVRQVIENIKKHLADEGYFMCSIATFPDYDPSIGAVFHQTVQPKEWWVEQFEKAGLTVVEQNIIGKDDWLRGSGNIVKDMDWHEDEDLGFHLVLKKSNKYLMREEIWKKS
jgi:SAM-dependent methyltransferase